MAENLMTERLKTERSSAKNSWVICPICGGKTRNQVREDTVLINFPLFCPKCKNVTLIDLKKLNIEKINENQIYKGKTL